MASLVLRRLEDVAAGLKPGTEIRLQRAKRRRMYMVKRRRKLIVAAAVGDALMKE